MVFFFIIDIFYRLASRYRRICVVAARVSLGWLEVDDRVIMGRSLDICEWVEWVGLDS
jgi:hypothetical protein